MVVFTKPVNSDDPKLYGSGGAGLCTTKDNFLCIQGMQCWDQQTIMLYAGGGGIILLLLVIIISK